VIRLVKGTVDFGSLSEVLRNPTRRKIILYLSDKGSISYVDLMNSVEITNTGKFNYHLKILGDLLEKGENGKYSLSEKGRLAVQFLQKFDGSKTEEQVFKTRAFSLFAGFIWLVSVYLFLGLVFGWYLYFTEPTVMTKGNLATPLITLSVILIPAFGLIAINQFPVIEIDQESIVVKWATGRRFFSMEEVKMDVRGHILRLGERRMPFGWFIPFKEDECFNLLNKHVETYRSKALYLTFALPPTFLTFLFAFASRLEGVFPPDLWAVFWGVTIAISSAMFAYSFPAEIHLGKMNRGISSIIYGVFVGVIIAVSLFPGLFY
jgi:hypothetical protein